MKGQIDIFNVDTRFMDKSYDRYGNERTTPKWANYERCENCTRWVIHNVKDQPPSGWGVKGFCNAHCQGTDGFSYCGNWEDKRKM